MNASTGACCVRNPIYCEHFISKAAFYLAAPSNENFSLVERATEQIESAAVGFSYLRIPC